ncbi:uncharacterized protein LOC141632830 [Silene latifolia]|uniref:uncharacterized protein LOC141632830 n=1 Tax=Silene latifolia TaxID=37657 RepID=UPI003D786BF7
MVHGDTSGDKSPTRKASLHPVFTVTNIQNKVRVLDGVKVSYASWVNLFTLHARGYKVLNHIDGTPAPAETDASYDSWTEVDAHVLQWIYGTLSDDLLSRVLEPDATAYQAWNHVKNIFLNNKGARAAALEQEFSNLKLASLPSLDAYCQRLRQLAGQLKDVDAAVSEQRLVLKLVRGLPSEYDTVAAYINQTLPNFETARSMLELEQHRKSSRDDIETALVAPPAASKPSWPDSPIDKQPSYQPRQQQNNRQGGRRGNNNNNNRGGYNRGGYNNKSSNNTGAYSGNSLSSVG